MKYVRGLVAFTALGVSVQLTGTAAFGASVDTTAAVSIAAPSGPAADFTVKTGRLQPGESSTYVPQSSIAKVEDAGRFAHTNYQIVIPSGEMMPQSQVITPKVGAPPYSGYFYETPASLACIYKLVTQASGCDPNKVTARLTIGGSKVIAIVDAYHNPSALADLQKTSTQFGLPAPLLQVVYASGVQPPVDWGWALESALDIQMAHAMAPQAKIILVEAASNSFNDLLVAEDKASALVAAAGGGQVSNSWGSGEFNGEATLDTHFATPKVTYFASTGDWAGTEWPSVSSKVIAVGGTNTSRNPFTGVFRTETAWSDTGGGVSYYIPRPSYQDPIASVVGSYRGVPDLSFDAGPETGVWVYCGTACNPYSGWYIVGGTSVSSPAVAGITNLAGGFATSSADELTKIYNGLGTVNFLDVQKGLCGPYAGYFAGIGWDFCTGVGSPRGKVGL